MEIEIFQMTLTGFGFAFSIGSLWLAGRALRLNKDSLESSIVTLINERQNFIHELTLSSSPNALKPASIKAGYERLYSAFDFGCKKYYSQSIDRDDFIFLYTNEIKRLVDINHYNLMNDPNKFKAMRKFSSEHSV